MLQWEPITDLYKRHVAIPSHFLLRSPQGWWHQRDIRISSTSYYSIGRRRPVEHDLCTAERRHLEVQIYLLFTGFSQGYSGLDYRK
jgi:hypothetical protein